MTDGETVKLPARWWTWLRLAVILVTFWMAIGFFVMQEAFNDTTKMAAARNVQAAGLAGVPLSQDERSYLGNPALPPDPLDGNRSDQVVAIGSLAAFESDRSSDQVTAMVATATAGVGSLVVFFAGLRDWTQRHRAFRKKPENRWVDYRSSESAPSRFLDRRTF